MKRDLFNTFCEKVRSFGYQVYLNKDESGYNYAVVTDGKNVGYMQEAEFNQKGVTFSTVHVPSTGNGTGFRCQTDGWPVTLDELSPRHVQESFRVVPDGFGFITGPVIKYDDFEDWKKRSMYASLYEI